MTHQKKEAFRFATSLKTFKSFKVPSRLATGLLALGLSASLGVACSSESSGGTSENVTPENAAKAYEDAVKEVTQRCGASDVLLATYREEALLSVFKMGGFQASFFNQLSKCAESIKSASCSVNVYSSSECRAVFRQAGEPAKGTLSDGAACVMNQQCSTGYCSGEFDEGGIKCGTCVQAAKEGESCRRLTSCGSGLYCFQGSVCKTLPQVGDACDSSGCGEGSSSSELFCSNGTCQKKAKLGESCGSNGVQCSFEYTCVNNKCTAEASLGQACSSDYTSPSTAAPHCNDSLWFRCDEATQKCKARTLVSLGGDCSGNNNTCGLNGVCSYSATTSSSTCVALKKKGESCAADGDECMDYLDCVSGVCTLKEGTSCK